MKFNEMVFLKNEKSENIGILLTVRRREENLDFRIKTFLN